MTCQWQRIHYQIRRTKCYLRTTNVSTFILLLVVTHGKYPLVGTELLILWLISILGTANWCCPDDGVPGWCLFSRAVAMSSAMGKDILLLDHKLDSLVVVTSKICGTLCWRCWSFLLLLVDMSAILEKSAEQLPSLNALP